MVIHSKSGILRRDQYVIKWCYKSINKLAKGIHSNQGIMIGGVTSYVCLVQNTLVWNFGRQNIFKKYHGILNLYSYHRCVFQNILWYVFFSHK